MLLLDTHVLLWWAAKPARLSSRATREIARAKRILVSPISFWEITTLVRRGVIELDRPLFDWIGAILDQDRIAPAPLTATSAASAGMLGADFPADPVDRLLYSTARELAVPLVTKDARIREFALDSRDVRVLW